MTDTKELIDRYYEAFNTRNWDAYEELFAPEAAGWAAGMVTSGLQAIREFDKAWASAFPDARITSLRKSASGEAIVASENRFSGTHTAPLRTPGGEVAPTGKFIDLPYAALFEAKGGKLTAQRIYYDRQEVQSQLGLQ
jgi:predicted ester cyclase